MKAIEGVVHIGYKIASAGKPVGVEELHVVCVERVGQHQVPFTGDLNEKR